MSGVKMEQVVLRNFKCHKEFKVGLSELNILTGSNAAGKSSFIQAILLAFQSWEEYDQYKLYLRREPGNPFQHCF